MCSSHTLFPFFFFFNDTATTEIYTLSLHDALPISGDPPGRGQRRAGLGPWLASELGFGLAHATRDGADAADGDASIGDVAVVERDRHGDADRGPLEEAELEVRRRRPRRQRREHDSRERVAGPPARPH